MFLQYNLYCSFAVYVFAVLFLKKFFTLQNVSICELNLLSLLNLYDTVNLSCFPIFTVHP